MRIKALPSIENSRLEVMVKHEVKLRWPKQRELALSMGELIDVRILAKDTMGGAVSSQSVVDLIIAIRQMHGNITLHAARGYEGYGYDDGMFHLKNPDSISSTKPGDYELWVHDVCTSTTGDLSSRYYEINKPSHCGVPISAAYRTSADRTCAPLQLSVQASDSSSTTATTMQRVAAGIVAFLSVIGLCLLLHYMKKNRQKFREMIVRTFACLSAHVYLNVCLLMCVC